MKKILLLILSLVIAISFTTSAWSGKLTVMLDWFPNPDHAPLVIAMQQGYFKEQGLDVDLKTPSDPSDPTNLVASREVDIAITYEPEFIELVDKGMPLMYLGSLIDKPLDCLVTLSGNGIKSPADLKGKRIGMIANGLGKAMLNVMLLQNGLSEKDVQIINSDTNLSQALVNKKIDVAAGLMRNVEVPQLELKGHHIAAFFPEEHGVPNYSLLIFVVNKANAKDNRFPRFLTAIKKAVRYLDEHPRESWMMFIKQYPEANNEVNRESWFATMPYFAENPASFNQEEWQNFAEFMQKNNMIKKVQPLSRYTKIS